jgi:hypothetical protein
MEIYSAAFAGERARFFSAFAAGCRVAHGCKGDLGKNSIYISLANQIGKRVHRGFN